MTGMPGNPHAGTAAQFTDAQTEATLALAFEVRTVALLLASSMAGTADSADDQHDEAMRRMGETDE